MSRLLSVRPRSVKTSAWFGLMLRGCEARPAARAAAVGVCRAFGLVAESAPAHIANVIEAELLRLEGGDPSCPTDR